MWHVGRSAGVGLFSAICTAVVLIADFVGVLDGHGGMSPKNARYVPSTFFGLAMIVGPLAGVLWHQYYMLIDRRFVKAQRIHRPSSGNSNATPL